MALDQITRALVDEFLEETGLSPISEAKDYERFAAHVFTSPHADAVPEYYNILVGDGDDTGLDTISIIVNGRLMTDIDELRELISKGSTLNVHYIFVQTTTASNFATAKIRQLEDGVIDFFRHEHRIRRNEAVAAAAQISRLLIDSGHLFHNGNPSCAIYYCSAAKRAEDTNIINRATAGEEAVADLGLFSRVSFNLVSAQEMQHRYRESTRGLVRELQFPNSSALPDIPFVEQAHIGFVPATDLLSIVKDAEGNLLTTIFYDNVRDFEGLDNSVNAEIVDTLSSSARVRFPLMNNGITVLAKKVRQTGNKFYITDFQIVNGCQTANVLWSLADQLDETVQVPLRLISTENEDVISDVIRATNRQTEIKEEQFHASREYMKHLELYFDTAPEARRLFFERRANQYTSAGVERTRVVPFHALVRSFASIVGREPHRATRNYKRVLDGIPESIFNPDHLPVIYYATASALYRLEYMFRNSLIDRKFSPAKYHLLLASALEIESGLPSRLNGRDAERWANSLLTVYWNMPVSEKIFEKASIRVNDLAQGDLDRDTIRTQNFTALLLDSYIDRGESAV